MLRRVCISIAATICLTGSLIAQTGNGMPEYREGDYKTAIPLLSAKNCNL